MPMFVNENDVFEILKNDSAKIRFGEYVQSLYGDFFKNILQRLESLEKPGADSKDILSSIREEIAELYELWKENNEASAAVRSSFAKEHRKECAEFNQEMQEKRLAISQQMEALQQRENQLCEQEKAAAQGFNARRDQILADVDKLRETFETLSAELQKQELHCKERVKELTQARSSYYTELSKKVLEEGSRLLTDLEMHADKLREERLVEIDAVVKQRLDAAEAQLREAQARSRAAKRAEEDNETERQELDEQRRDIEAEVNRRVKLSMDKLQAERDSYKTQAEMIPDLIKEINQGKQQLNSLTGDIICQEGQELTPADVSNLYLSMKRELHQTRERLHALPSEAQIAALTRIRSEYDELLKQMEADKARAKAIPRIEHDLDLAHVDLEALRQQKESLQVCNASLLNSVNMLEARLQRYSEDEQKRKENHKLCVERLENPADFPVKRLPEITSEEFLDNLKDQETDWLDGIHKKLEENGYVFSKRILYAFHTSLKTNEMSPLTVLAGVSGTGKSELPRLYAEYGGLNYYMVSVQPNWDSQEAMLGYYNSLDNRFESQPLLQYLIASKLPSAQGGFRDQMSIVLLDEMNLAHVELYFAEFLSKLEQRRGNMTDLPQLSVNISADLKYHIPMDRNVLWIGTMNQDETTKALSDKVLDRSNCLYFPRPSSLVTRTKLARAQAVNYRITKDVWQSWICDVDGSGIGKKFQDELRHYKGEIEAINNELGRVGRGIGHRVWQSILYYMVNYPTVLDCLFMDGADTDTGRNELANAFQDQLVQKIMPKLRGIECRGNGKKCLENIFNIIARCAEPLKEDFHKAMEFGQGQFLWLSADYLNK